MTWDKHTKPPADVCPERYCFHWAPPGSAADLSGRTSDSFQKAITRRDDWVKFPHGGCACGFGLCTRLDPVAGDHDFYEPEEWVLERGELSWFYFIPSVEKVALESREEYQRESQTLWGDGEEAT